MSIVLHELARYVTALLSGAADVSVHGAVVARQLPAVYDTAQAAKAFLGPLSGHLMVLIAVGAIGAAHLIRQARCDKVRSS